MTAAGPARADGLRRLRRRARGVRRRGAAPRARSRRTIMRRHSSSCSQREPPRGELAAAYERLGGDVAVRSSACAEDSEAASFAGQQETYLHVAGADDVGRARRRLLGLLLQRAGALLPGAEGVARRPRHGGGRAAHGRAGEVGRTLHRRSGPAAPRPDGARGRLRARRAGRLRRGHTRPLRPRPPGRGEARAASSRAACSSAAELVRLADLGRLLETHFGGPQDVEWALAGGEIHLLQSRPVTTL